MFDFEHYFDTHPDKGWMYNQKPYFNVSVPLDPEEEWQVYSAGAIFYRGQKRHIYLLKDYEYVDFNGQLISKENDFVDKMIFIISGLYNEYKNNECDSFYCADKEIQQKLNFSKKVYELLKI